MKSLCPPTLPNLNEFIEWSFLNAQLVQWLQSERLWRSDIMFCWCFQCFGSWPHYSISMYIWCYCLNFVCSGGIGVECKYIHGRVTLEQLRYFLFSMKILYMLINSVLPLANTHTLSIIALFNYVPWEELKTKNKKRFSGKAAFLIKDFLDLK